MDSDNQGFIDTLIEIAGDVISCQYFHDMTVTVANWMLRDLVVINFTNFNH